MERVVRDTTFTSWYLSSAREKDNPTASTLHEEVARLADGVCEKVDMNRFPTCVTDCERVLRELFLADRRWGRALAALAFARRCIQEAPSSTRDEYRRRILSTYHLHVGERHGADDKEESSQAWRIVAGSVTIFTGICIYIYILRRVRDCVK